MASASIRPARLTDVPSILALEENFPEADRISPRSLRRFLKSPSASCLVSADEAVSGAAVILFRSGQDWARLYSISVAKSALGRGTGKALTDAVIAEAQARGCKRLRLEVRPSNTRAISLYERTGFCVIGRKHAYYDDGEDALHMELPLLARNTNAS